MSNYTTQHCKDFLDEELQLNKSNWKRLSKKKENGFYTRVFECSVNHLKVDVLETPTGLIIGQPENTKEVKNKIKATKLNVKNVPTKVKSKIKTKNIKISPALLDLANEYRRCFIESDWSEIFQGDISIKNNQERYIRIGVQAAEQSSFWGRMANLCEDLINLSNDEFTCIINEVHKQIPKAKLFQSIANRIGETIDAVKELDSDYTPDHIGENFENLSAGVSQMYNILVSTAKSMQDIGIKLSNADKAALESINSATVSLIDRQFDYMSDDVNDHESFIDEYGLYKIRKVVKSYEAGAFFTIMEKQELEKVISPTKKNSNPEPAFKI